MSNCINLRGMTRISNSLQSSTIASFPLHQPLRSQNTTNDPDRVGVCVTSNFASLPIGEPTFSPTPYVSQMFQQYLTALQCKKNTDTSLPDENNAQSQTFLNLGCPTPESKETDFNSTNATSPISTIESKVICEIRAMKSFIIALVLIQFFIIHRIISISIFTIYWCVASSLTCTAATTKKIQILQRKCSHIQGQTKHLFNLGKDQWQRKKTNRGRGRVYFGY